MSATIELHPTRDTSIVTFFGICGEDSTSPDPTDVNKISQRVHLITSNYYDATGTATKLSWSEQVPNATQHFPTTDFRHRVRSIRQMTSDNLTYTADFDQHGVYFMYNMNFNPGGTPEGGDDPITNGAFATQMAMIENFERWPSSGGAAGTAWNSGAVKDGSVDASGGSDYDYFNTSTGSTLIDTAGHPYFSHDFTHMLPGRMYWFQFYPDPRKAVITLPEFYNFEISTRLTPYRITTDCTGKTVTTTTATTTTATITTTTTPP